MEMPISSSPSNREINPRLSSSSLSSRSTPSSNACSLPQASTSKLFTVWSNCISFIPVTSSPVHESHIFPARSLAFFLLQSIFLAACRKVKQKAAAVCTHLAAKATKAKKETVKKAVEAEIKDEVFVQFAGREINVEAVVAAAKADYKAKGHRTPKTVSVYIKPEEGVAYYTVKGVGSEDYKVEL